MCVCVCVCVCARARTRASHYNTVTQYNWQLFSSLEVSIEVKYCSIQGLLTARLPQVVLTRLDEQECYDCLGGRNIGRYNPCVLCFFVQGEGRRKGDIVADS